MVQQTASPHKVSEPIGPDSPVSTSACQSQPPANMHAPTHLISRQIGLNNTLLIRLWVQMPEIEKPMELDANMHAPTHLIWLTLLIWLWVQMPEIEKTMELDAPACHKHARTHSPYLMKTVDLVVGADAGD